MKNTQQQAHDRSRKMLTVFVVQKPKYLQERCVFELVPPVRIPTIPCDLPRRQVTPSAYSSMPYSMVDSTYAGIPST
jgi:hypothetical protein